MSFELDNSKYNFPVVPFNVDKSLGDHIHAPFPSASFFWVLVGSAGAGKTSMMVNSLISKGSNRVYRKVFDKIVLVQPKNSRMSIKNNPFEDLDAGQIFEKLDYNVLELIEQNKKEFDEDKNKKKKNMNQLLILDDITASLKDNEDILLQLTTNRRHIKLSIILLVQHLRSISRSVRFQITDITLFKPSNGLDEETIHEEFVGNMNTKEFKKLSRFVWKVPYDNLFINKTTNTLYKNLQKINNIN